MVHRLNIFLLSIILVIAQVITMNHALAGAAEKWEYDVIPDQSQTLQIKGHKVDQYGAAVNDYDYNTKIDPKTAANRTKMGTVGMGRLLKITGWGLLGSVALEALLNSIDWVIDPETQSIWRNKKPEGSSYNCIYLDSTGKKQFVFRVLQQGTTYHDFNCPADAANKLLEMLKQYQGIDSKFSEWVIPLSVALTSSTGSINFKAIRTYPNGQTEPELRSVSVYTKPYTAPAPEKEYLTPEALADYANHTHPDYSNPELAPKLEPKYSPEIQSDLWKPSNPWEDANSPTVQEVKKELEKASPEPKEEPEIKPNPDTGGLTLPSFCSWAAPVCEFINSFKELPETSENTEVEIDQTVPQVPNTSYFSWGPYCPFSPGSQTISLENTSAGIDYDLTSWCELASDIRPFVLAAGALMSFLIVAGVVMGRDD